LRSGSKLGSQGTPATISTYISWLNQVERRFGIITQMAIRRGSFSSVREPVSRIKLFVEHCSAKATPFRWTATANSILATVQRLCAYISGTQHQAAMPGIPEAAGRVEPGWPQGKTGRPEGGAL